MLRTRRAQLLAGALATALVAAGCSGDDDATAETTDAGTTTTGSEPEDTTAGAGLDTELASVCPETIAVQTDWHPESEHGMLYHLLGDDYDIDTDLKATRGSLTIGGVDTGVEIEVRAGGPAIGFEPVASQMYADDTLMLGYAGTDGQFLNHETPMLSVLAPMEVWPQIIYWDPDVLPEVDTIAELGEQGVTISYFADAVYTEVLTAQGVLHEDQLDPSYDGTPGRFIAEAQAGRPFAQQGYSSSEPYAYEHLYEEYGKQLEWELIHDTGFRPYTATIAIRPDDLETLRPCLERLVPIMQQATVDYFEDPAATNELIVEVVEAYDSGWEYSLDQAEWAVQAQLEDGIVGNGTNGTVGDIDPARVQSVFDQLQAADLDTGDVTPEATFTNEFIDESIGF